MKTVMLGCLAAGAAVLLSGCESSFSTPPTAAGAPLPGTAGTAPAVANMGCVQAGSAVFGRPWQTVVLGGSRPLYGDVYEVQVRSGIDGRQVLCTVDNRGTVMAVAERS